MVWWIRLGVALVLCGWLQLSFWAGWCRRQPGCKICDHANLILLYALPWIWAQELRLYLAVLLLTAFYVALHRQWLIADVGGRFNHHANLLLLVALPWQWTQAIGWVTFLDDVANHLLKRWMPGWESPLHRLGRPLYWLRDQIGYRLPEGSRLRDWLLAL